MRCSILPFFLGLICSACVENYDADPTTTVDTGTSSQDTATDGTDTAEEDDSGEGSEGGDSASDDDTSSGGGEDTGGSKTDTGTTDTGTVDPEPPENETDCTDGIDEDEDGLTDCEDEDCAESSACVETDCGDEIDNDGDGAVDCEDSDCAGAAECTVCEDEDLGTATGDALATGSNTGTGDDSSGSCIGGSLAEDVAFRWEAPDDNCYVVDTEDSDYDTSLYIWTDCGGTEVDCDDDGGAGTTSMIEFCASAGDEYIIVVDGYSSTSVGNYSLDINVAPESICDDGLDNDGNGDIDCDDANCSSDPACYESVCDDTLDDDGDGDIDCDDSDCALNLSCTSATECPALELGDATGDRLAFGNNVGWMDDENGSCGSSGGEDVMVSWEAPADGCYTFGTDSSDYDTVLRQMDACGGIEIDCDDDGGTGTTSNLEVVAIAGDVIYISIDGYSSSYTGTFVLDVNEGCASAP